jgi:hypothetical protein
MSLTCSLALQLRSVGKQRTGLLAFNGNAFNRHCIFLQEIHSGLEAFTDSLVFDQTRSIWCIRP